MMSPRLRTLLMTSTALLALGSMLSTLGAGPAGAQPTGPNVVGGNATVSGAGTNSVIINQTTDRAIINWNTFNVSSGGSATFNQPGSSSITLNRVTGGLGPSVIDGTITANGRVFIINRDGMLFGRGAVINTAGFLATTNDIRNADFMAGRINFNIPGRSSASIVNYGNITAHSGGFAALVAPGVRNAGTISAHLGTVALASGNSFTLDMYGDRLIQVAVGDEIAGKVIDVATGKPLSSLVTNEGTLRANGGRVEITAAAARHIVDSVINNKGVIEANSVGTRNGRIVLGGATQTAGLPKQTIKVSGKISATGKDKGQKGGTIQITGEDIQFAAAMKAATAASSRCRASSSSPTPVWSTRARPMGSRVYCCSIRRSSTSMRQRPPRSSAISPRPTSSSRPAPPVREPATSGSIPKLPGRAATA
jgi:filamentous hemagglutinin family protein